MKWNKFTLKTRSQVEDIVISTLAEAGVEGVEIEDKVPLTEEDKKQMFVDILPQGPEDDGIAYLSFYLEEGEDKSALLERVKEALEELRGFVDIGEGTITESETEDKDWINNWKEYFHQFYVDDILIIPSWEEVSEEDKDKMIIHIDPGTAFGTGIGSFLYLLSLISRFFCRPGSGFCWQMQVLFRFVAICQFAIYHIFLYKLQSPCLLILMNPATFIRRHNGNNNPFCALSAATSRPM